MNDVDDTQQSPVQAEEEARDAVQRSLDWQDNGGDAR